MTSFAALAGGLCPTQEALALSLATELGCPEDDARVRLQARATGLPTAGAPLEQLESARRVAQALSPAAGGTLLLPRALAGGGHPAVVAVATVAVTQRAGYGVEPVADGDGRLYLAHPDLDRPLVVDPGDPRQLLDGRTLGVDLHWRCAHETALCLLDHVIASARRSADLSTMLAASALRLALPLEDDARRGIATDHARLLARLN
jgi:hypothetical protein